MKLVYDAKWCGGEKNIDEVTRLLKLWIQDSPLKSIALKAIHVMPALLLQKPSKNSKSKDHLVSLERRLKLGTYYMKER